MIEDQTNDKQRKWHPEVDQGKRAEAGYLNMLQVPQKSCLMMAQNQGVSQGLHKSALTKLNLVGWLFWV